MNLTTSERDTPGKVYSAILNGEIVGNDTVVKEKPWWKNNYNELCRGENTREKVLFVLL